MFSVLIPSWNNLAYLKVCIESIEKNSSFTHQILVHLNEGTDGSVAYLKKKGIEYTISETNIGICKALNLISKKASTSYISYFNDDMYALPGWDFHLYKEIEALGHENFFVSGTMIEPKAGKNLNMIQGKDFGDLNNFKEKELIAFHQQLVFKDWYGASWPPNVVHKNLWEKVGGYSDEYSPGMYSDPDFSMKLWQEGVRVFKGIGASRVYHFMSKSTGKILKNDGRKTFIEKWKITPGFFYKNMIKMGKTYNGELKSNFNKLAYFLMKIKIIFLQYKK